MGSQKQIQYMLECLGGTSNKDLLKDVETAQMKLAELAHIDKNSNQEGHGADITLTKVKHVISTVLNTTLSLLPPVITAAAATLTRNVDSTTAVHWGIGIQGLLASVNMAISVANLFVTLQYLGSLELQKFRDLQSEFRRRMIEIAEKIMQSHLQFSRGERLQYTFTFLSVELQSLRGDIVRHVQKLQMEKDQLEMMEKSTKFQRDQSAVTTVITGAATAVTLIAAPPLGAAWTAAATLAPIMNAVTTGVKMYELGCVQEKLCRVDELLKSAEGLEREINDRIAKFGKQLEEMKKTL